MRIDAFLACLLALPGPAALADDAGLGGHVKARLTGESFGGDSVFRDVAGAHSLDGALDFRLGTGVSTGAWTFEAQYLLEAQYGERVEIARAAGGAFPGSLQPGDERRLFDLSQVVEEGGRRAVVHRLDRLHAGYRSAKLVLRFGRQAITWGNGLFFTPMDLVNPFDPAAIDTEYKTGDDMLYAQYLFDGGNDLQSAVVPRRSESGNVTAGESTWAARYHVFRGDLELDLFAARHYGENVLGLGAAGSLGGAVWRGDVVLTDTDEGIVTQAVWNLSYSWTFAGRNMSGNVEAYFDGFGQHGGRYDAAGLAANTALLERLERGERFTLGRTYLAGSVTIEITPLLRVTPTAFANLRDPSALLQLVTDWSLSDECVLLASVNLPVGPQGSEFGGIPAATAGRYRSFDAGVFAQLAWYF